METRSQTVLVFSAVRNFETGPHFASYRSAVADGVGSGGWSPVGGSCDKNCAGNWSFGHLF